METDIVHAVYTGLDQLFNYCDVANYGGGIHLELTSVLSIVKVGMHYTVNAYNLYFTSNSAGYGGAMFVDDRTNFETWATSNDSEMVPDAFFITSRVPIRKKESGPRYDEIMMKYDEMMMKPMMKPMMKLMM